MALGAGCLCEILALAVSPHGHFLVCEDKAGDATNHLRGITPDGQLYTLARLNLGTELAGACFSPDGEVLFVNAYARSYPGDQEGTVSGFNVGEQVIAPLPAFGRLGWRRAPTG